MENRLPRGALPWQDQSDLNIKPWRQIFGSPGHPFSIKALMQEKLASSFIISGFFFLLGIIMQFQNSIRIYGQHAFLNHSLGKRQRWLKLFGASLYECFALPEVNSEKQKGVKGRDEKENTKYSQPFWVFLPLISRFSKLMAVKSKDYLFSPPDKTGGRSCWLNTAKLLEKSLWTRAAFQRLLLPLTEFQALTESF